MCLLYSLRFKSTYKVIAAKFLFEKINKQLLPYLKDPNRLWQNI